MNSTNDIVIIGAGIIGLAVAYKMSRRYPKLKITILEKESEIAYHQTGHNSGVIHSGVYYQPNSYKARFCIDGVSGLLKFCDENNINYLRCGKVIVATSQSELASLHDISRRGISNGVEGIEIINKERLQEIEPHTFGIAALHIPTTGIVDFKHIANTYAKQFLNIGGQIETNTKVSAITRNKNGFIIVTTRGHIESRYLINCSGLYADKVARMCGIYPKIRIIPFRGEYYRLREERRHLVKALIYPVPNSKFPFLGVHFTRNIHGAVEAGPNAVLALAREGYKKTDFNFMDLISTTAYPGFWAIAMKHWKTGIHELHRSFSKRIFTQDLQRLIPEIEEDDLIEGGSGVRAQAVDKSGKLIDDFVIHQDYNSIHILNAPSPGATASLAIGEHITRLTHTTLD